MKTNQFVKHPSAWIVTNNRKEPSQTNDRGRRKIYKDNTVYIDNDTEFEIELFNPTSDNVLSMIKVNNKVISKSGLIIRPGERIYLDCFLDDRKKFKFETYTVDNVKEVLNVISDNGLIEISFYKEDITILEEFPKFDWTYNPTTIYDNGQYNCGIYQQPNMCSLIIGGTGTTTGTSRVCTTLSGTTTSICNTSNTNSNSIVYGNNTSINHASLFAQTPPTKTIETGQVSKGDVSEQKFNEVSMKFSKYQLGSIKYKLLPSSTKPLTSDDIKPKNFCNKCGRKLVETDCFCGSCGNKLK